MTSRKTPAPPRKKTTIAKAKPAAKAPLAAKAPKASKAPIAAKALARAKPSVPAKAPLAAKPPLATKPPLALSEPAPVKAPKRDVKHFEARLLEERGRLLKELGYLEQNVLKQNQRESSGDLSGYSFHMADLGTDAMEREKAFLFASAEGRALYDVDEALRRLYGGAYGTCETCAKVIASERLDVVPHARLCVSCKEREEKAGRR